MPQTKGGKSTIPTPFFKDYQKSIGVAWYVNPITPGILEVIHDKYVNQTACPNFLEATTKHLIDAQK